MIHEIIKNINVTWAIISHDSNNNHTLISLMQLVLLVHPMGANEIQWANMII
jgi:hypothetical protein